MGPPHGGVGLTSVAPLILQDKATPTGQHPCGCPLLTLLLPRSIWHRKWRVALLAGPAFRRMGPLNGRTYATWPVSSLVQLRPWLGRLGVCGTDEVTHGRLNAQSQLQLGLFVPFPTLNSSLAVLVQCRSRWQPLLPRPWSLSASPPSPALHHFPRFICSLLSY